MTPGLVALVALGLVALALVPAGIVLLREAVRRLLVRRDERRLARAGPELARLEAEATPAEAARELERKFDAGTLERLLHGLLEAKSDGESAWIRDVAGRL